MIDFSVVREQLYNVGAAIFTPLFFVEAKQTQQYPYGVVSLVTLPTNRDTGNDYHEIYFQYQLFGKNLITIENVKKLLDAAYLNKAGYEFDDYKIVGLHQTIHIRPDHNNGAWQVGSAFKLELQGV